MISLRRRGQVRQSRQSFLNRERRLKGGNGVMLDFGIEKLFRDAAINARSIPFSCKQLRQRFDFDACSVRRSDADEAGRVPVRIEKLELVIITGKRVSLTVQFKRCPGFQCP
jgi:hypothetical protein